MRESTGLIFVHVQGVVDAEYAQIGSFGQITDTVCIIL